MNDLFSTSFSQDSRNQEASPPPHHVIQMSETPSSASGDSLAKFLDDADAVKSEVKELERLNKNLRSDHEQSKTLHSAAAVRELRSRMDAEVSAALRKAKAVKERLEAMDRSNTARKGVPGCGPGSSEERTRTAVVSGLRKMLKEEMESFVGLRETISSEYRETVRRRYFTVTGENPEEKTLDRLISTGESETFLQKAIEEQGRGRILDTINEIQERHNAVKDIEKNLKELHQVFMDMSVLVQAQGQQLDDIESNMQRASSFVQSGNRQLLTARKLQKNSRFWTCVAIVVLLLIILFIVLFVIRP